jgi:hypothetical protein
MIFSDLVSFHVTRASRSDAVNRYCSPVVRLVSNVVTTLTTPQEKLHRGHI